MGALHFQNSHSTPPTLFHQLHSASPFIVHFVWQLYSSTPPPAQRANQKSSSFLLTGPVRKLVAQRPNLSLAHFHVGPIWWFFYLHTSWLCTPTTRPPRRLLRSSSSLRAHGPGGPRWEGTRRRLLGRRRGRGPNGRAAAGGALAGGAGGPPSGERRREWPWRAAPAAQEGLRQAAQ